MVDAAIQSAIWCTDNINVFQRGHVPLKGFPHIIYIANDVFAASDIALYL